jgi:hypothetical protein
MVVVRVNWMNIIVTLMYLVGLITLLIIHDFVSAGLMVAILYWTHRAWYLEGERSMLTGMLMQAKDLIDKSIKTKEPVSLEENQNV